MVADSLSPHPSPSLKQTEAAKRRLFRKDIQALRAFAVLAVVLNHLWPQRLVGGFIGVDIFFVISGFLISSHLLKHTLEHGSVDLWQFYSRRIRRLLPAAFTVILFSFLAVWWLLPSHLQLRNYAELLASAAYGENIFLFVNAVDYHAANQSTTLAQHYWSLSVEEQFYFLWPLLLILVASLSRLRRRLFTTVFISIFTLGFFVFSLWFSHYSPAQAYFFTPVRFWEFGVGALVAILAPFLASLTSRSLIWLRLFLAFLAWMLLFACTLLITPQMLFPGWVALVPTLSTAVIIAVGCAGPLPVLRWFTDFKPVQLMGDASYSIYLWHWPLIMLTPYLIRDILHWQEKLALIPLTFILGYLSKRFIEDKGLEVKWFADSVKRTFCAMLAAIAGFGLLFTVLHTLASQQVAAADESFKQVLASGCVGPNSLDASLGCENKLELPVSTSLPAEADYTKLPEGCVKESKQINSEQSYAVVTCDFRTDKSGGSAKQLFLVGDSHAEQWNAALTEVARKQQLRLEVHTIPGCPVHQWRSFMSEADAVQSLGHQCALGSSLIMDTIAQVKPATVVYSSYAKTEYLGNLPGEDLPVQDRFNRAYKTTWDYFKTAGVEQAVVIADTPYNDAVRNVNCWNFAQNPALSCRVPRAEALGHDPLLEGAQQPTTLPVKLVDFTDAFCDADYCYAVLGQLPVYFDTTHVSTQYTKLLVPKLEKELGY